MIEYLDPQNFGVVRSKLDSDNLAMVWELVKRNSPKSAKWDNNRLLDIETHDKQWAIRDPDRKFENNVLRPCIDAYINHYGLPCKTKTTHTHDIVFNRLWCRASTRHDYHSLHDHKSILTFILWLNVPVDSRIEKNIEYGFRPEAGEVVLTYSDITGSHRKMNFDLSPENNGQMIVFPSDINHCVYPTHTTDEYRLSVAGDISLSSLDIHKIIDPESDPRLKS